MYVLCIVTALYPVVNRACIRHWLTLFVYGKHKTSYVKCIRLHIDDG